MPWEVLNSELGLSALKGEEGMGVGMLKESVQ